MRWVSTQIGPTNAERGNQRNLLHYHVYRCPIPQGQNALRERTWYADPTSAHRSACGAGLNHSELPGDEEWRQPVLTARAKVLARQLIQEWMQLVPGNIAEGATF